MFPANLLLGPAQHPSAQTLAAAGPPARADPRHLKITRTCQLGCNSEIPVGPIEQAPGCHIDILPTYK